VALKLKLLQQTKSKTNMHVIPIFLRFQASWNSRLRTITQHLQTLATVIHLNVTTLCASVCTKNVRRTKPPLPVHCLGLSAGPTHQLGRPLPPQLVARRAQPHVRQLGPQLPTQLLLRMRQARHQPPKAGEAGVSLKI